MVQNDDRTKTIGPEMKDIFDQFQDEKIHNLSDTMVSHERSC
jgi:hypothetical protein